MEEAIPAHTPLSPSTTLQLHDGIDATNATTFCQIIRAIQYLNLTHPKLSFSISKLFQYMHKPITLHLQHLKCLLCYVKQTINYGILLQRSSTNNLLAYIDTNQGGNSDDITSTFPFIIFLGGNPISWHSKEKKTNARLSIEAEYKVVATANSELMRLLNLLTELQVLMPHSPRLLCDKVCVTYLYANPVLHSHMKHISIDYHFVHEQVQIGRLQVSHVSTTDQLANILTKPLAAVCFRELTTKIKVTNGDFILRGRIG